MTWISGPCDDEPEEGRNVVPPVDDEELGTSVGEDEPMRWHVDMAPHGKNWVTLNYGHFPDRPRGTVGD